MPTCPSCRKQFPADITECPLDGDALLPDEAFAAAGKGLEMGAMVGEYRVEEMIGKGSYGEVYSAEHPLIGKRAAIKVLHKKFSSEPQVVSRFISEARAVNRIRHRNIIDIFSFGQLENERQYLIMELLDGETLESVLSRGKMTLAEAYPILRGVAGALDAAHAEGVAHRDLKPENIFVATQKDGTIIPKLLDFGVAKLSGDENVKHKTATGMAVGTPLYMSPEQCRGKKVDHRADIYSFGVVIFETLCGRVPFDGDSAVEVLYKHMSEPPPSVADMASELPVGLDVPMHRMLAKHPDARPESASLALEYLLEAGRDAGMDVAIVDQARRSGEFGSPVRGTSTVVRGGVSGAATLDDAAKAVDGQSSTADTVVLATGESGTGDSSSTPNSPSHVSASASTAELTDPSPKGTLSALETNAEFVPRKSPALTIAAVAAVVVALSVAFMLAQNSDTPSSAASSSADSASDSASPTAAPAIDTAEAIATAAASASASATPASAPTASEVAAPDATQAPKAVTRQPVKRWPPRAAPKPTPKPGGMDSILGDRD
jgi:serine/threonine protein kinase